MEIHKSLHTHFKLTEEGLRLKTRKVRAYIVIDFLAPVNCKELLQHLNSNKKNTLPAGYAAISFGNMIVQMTKKFQCVLIWKVFHIP